MLCVTLATFGDNGYTYREGEKAMRTALLFLITAAVIVYSMSLMGIVLSAFKGDDHDERFMYFIVGAFASGTMIAILGVIGVLVK